MKPPNRIKGCFKAVNDAAQEVKTGQHKITLHHRGQKKKQTKRPKMWCNVFKVVFLSLAAYKDFYFVDPIVQYE